VNSGKKLHLEMHNPSTTPKAACSLKSSLLALTTSAKKRHFQPQEGIATAVLISRNYRNSRIVFSFRKHVCYYSRPACDSLCQAVTLCYILPFSLLIPFHAIAMALKEAPATAKLLLYRCFLEVLLFLKKLLSVAVDGVYIVNSLYTAVLKWQLFLFL